MRSLKNSQFLPLPQTHPTPQTPPRRAHSTQPLNTKANWDSHLNFTADLLFCCKIWKKKDRMNHHLCRKPDFFWCFEVHLNCAWCCKPLCWDVAGHCCVVAMVLWVVRWLLTCPSHKFHPWVFMIYWSPDLPSVPLSAKVHASFPHPGFARWRF